MITLSKPAEIYIGKKISEREGTVGIRFGVTGAGCGGYSYLTEYADKIEENDLVFEQGDVTILIDPKSHVLLDGVLVDYVTQGFNSGLEFVHPTATSCGCGESFSV